MSAVHLARGVNVRVHAAAPPAPPLSALVSGTPRGDSCRELCHFGWDVRALGGPCEP